MTDALNPLIDELARWKTEGRIPEFWWRDDDATEDLPSLHPLIGLAGDLQIPCILAVIPADLDSTLTRLVENNKFITPVQHGFKHQNHAPASEKKQELGNHRPLTVIEDELLQGKETLSQAFPRFYPALVPPWNRMHESIAARLTAMGYKGVSTFAQQRYEQAPRQINVHVDVIDWRGDRKQKPLSPLVADTVTHLAEKRKGSHDRQEPTGIMTHHKDQASQDWDVLKSLFTCILNEGGAFLDAPALFSENT